MAGKSDISAQFQNMLEELESSIAKKKEQLNDTDKELTTQKAILDKTMKEASDARKELQDAKNKLKDMKASFAAAESESAAKVVKDKADLVEAKAEYVKDMEKLVALEKRLADREADVERQRFKLAGKEAELGDKAAKVKLEMIELKDEKARLDAHREELNAIEKTFDAQKKEIKAGAEANEKKAAQIEAGIATLTTEQEAFSNKKDELIALRAGAEAERAAADKSTKELQKFYALGKELKIFIIQNSEDKAAIEERINKSFPSLNDAAAG
jgi:chromosome segregation ATPase